MNSKDLWQKYSQEVYFFILKRVKNKSVSNDILQNSFLKVHSKLHQLQEISKVKAWVFQIVRNEISNHFQSLEKTVEHTPENSEELNKVQNDWTMEICCFDQFVDELPPEYKKVIELTYISGKKQKEVAEELNLSLENVKARIRRSKSLLKKRFQECCQFKVDSKGNLVGPSNCSSCTV